MFTLRQRRTLGGNLSNSKPLQLNRAAHQLNWRRQKKNTWGNLVPFQKGKKIYIYVSNSSTDYGGLHNDHRGVCSLNTRPKIDPGFTQISTVKSQPSILPTFNRRWIPKPKKLPWRMKRQEAVREPRRKKPLLFGNYGSCRGLKCGIFIFFKQSTLIVERTLRLELYCCKRQKLFCFT